MNQPQEVIIYRSPFEKAQWDAWQQITGEQILGFVIWVVCLFVILHTFGNRKKSWQLWLLSFLSIPIASVIYKLMFFGLRFI